MELMTKQGYKQTEVGLIPEDWDLHQVIDLIDLLTDYDANGSFASVAENVKVYDYEKFAWYVRSTDLEKNSDLSDVRYVDRESYKFLKKTALYGGELLFLKRGDIGNVYLFKMKTKYATVAPNLYLLKLNEVSNSTYLYYYFISNQGQSQLKSKNASSTLGALYKDDVKAIYVPLPPTLTEQKAIATALSDVDALITSLEQTITKKKAIKQGAMQQLLTPPHKGGKRLPGFEGEWVEKTIKKIVSTPVSDGPHETPKFVREGIPFLSVNNIVNNKIDYSDLRFISKEDDEIYSRKCKPTKYDILLGKAASVGKVAVVENEWDFNIWSPLALIRCKETYSPYYVYYFFQTSDMFKQIDGLTNSSSQGNIGMGDIEKLKIFFPNTINEQQAIAQILSDMDAEIIQLETKKEKYQAIKQGMMQELLTGRTRFI